MSLSATIGCRSFSYPLAHRPESHDVASLGARPGGCVASLPHTSASFEGSAQASSVGPTLSRHYRSQTRPEKSPIGTTRYEALEPRDSIDTGQIEGLHGSETALPLMVDLPLPPCASKLMHPALLPPPRTSFTTVLALFYVTRTCAPLLY